LVWIVALSWVGWCPAEAIDEADFQATFREHVWPHYLAGEFGTFAGHDSVQIAYARFAVPLSKGALVILPGKSESHLKYAELVYDLRDCGYSLYLMDHRGMGLSGGLTADDPDKIYVERFEHYVADLSVFMDRVVEASPHQRRVILGHSMGATVALLYLEQYQDTFDAAILSAPMLQIITDPFPEWGAAFLGSVATLLGWGAAYCPGHGPRTSDGFGPDALTHCRCRWEMWHEEILPVSGIVGAGGATLRWLRESIEGGRRAREGAGRVTVPVVLFQAGDDQLVRPQEQDKVACRVRQCTQLVFPRAGHEILMERDPIRNVAISQVVQLLVELGEESSVDCSPAAHED